MKLKNKKDVEKVLISQENFKSSDIKGNFDQDLFYKRN